MMITAMGEMIRGNDPRLEAQQEMEKHEITVSQLTWSTESPVRSSGGNDVQLQAIRTEVTT